MSLSPFRFPEYRPKCLLGFLRLRPHIPDSVRLILGTHIRFDMHIRSALPLFPQGTTASADFPCIAVAGLSHPHGISRDKPLRFRRLPPRFTLRSYGCLLGFVAFSPLTRSESLDTAFLSVRLRLRYRFFYPPLAGKMGLASRYGVRWQLRPLGNLTPVQ